MSLGLAEFRREKSFDQVPSHCRSHRSSAHADDVQVIILHALSSGKMVVDQRSADASHLVGTNRCPDAAATDRHTALHLPCGHGPSKWNDKVGIVVARIECLSSEIDHLVSGRTKLREHLLL